MSERSIHSLPKPAISPAPPAGVLRRKCACGAQSHGTSECARCARKHGALQRKLSIGASSDALEIEAEHIADQVMQSPRAMHGGASCARHLSAESGGHDNSPMPASVDHALSSAGQPMPGDMRENMEQRFGRDFSQVRIHTDGIAEESARAVDALAYTAGNRIVFARGQFRPHAASGQRLLAHELSHVVQQSGAPANDVVRRCVNPKKNDPIFDGVGAEIRKTPAYKALADKALVEQIIVKAKAKAGCLYYIEKLKILFDTTEKAPAVISTETKSSTVAAAAEEQKRVAKPAAKKNLDAEEKASAAVDPAHWTKIKGKFGGGTYQVDRTNSRQIVVKAKVFLHPTGTGAVDDITNITGMEDAIEKAASTRGFIVDIEFVKDKSDPDTFDVEVDPSRWEVATNWSGGEPGGFAHELLHMFAYELDRYDYILNHSTNTSMTVPDRLIWFDKQLDKPPGFDNPNSIMGDTSKSPLDDDVCRVAGLDVATCVAERRKAGKP